MRSSLSTTISPWPYCGFRCSLDDKYNIQLLISVCYMRSDMIFSSYSFATFTRVLADNAFGTTSKLLLTFASKSMFANPVIIGNLY